MVLEFAFSFYMCIKQMVNSSIGISAPLLIGEESLIDPVVGIVTGIAYGGLKIFDKIRGRNNDEYVIDALTNDEE